MLQLRDSRSAGAFGIPTWRGNCGHLEFVRFRNLARSQNPDSLGDHQIWKQSKKESMRMCVCGRCGPIIGLKIPDSPRNPRNRGNRPGILALGLSMMQLGPVVELGVADFLRNRKELWKSRRDRGIRKKELKIRNRCERCSFNCVAVGKLQTG